MPTVNAALPVEVERSTGRGAHYLRLRGALNEHFSAALIGELEAVTILDLSGVEMVTSFGVSAWTRFIAAVPPSIRLYLVRCSSSIVNQLNLVMNFSGPAQVLSVLTAYFCPRCLLEVELPVDVLRHGALLRSGRSPSESCPECSSPLTFEDPGYFRFVSRCGARSIHPAAVRLLEELGVYQAQAAGRRRLEITKLVEEDVTLFRFAGCIDEHFRPQRILSGVEGAVALTLGDVWIAPSGRARWDELLGTLAAAASVVALVEVPASVAQLLEEEKIGLATATVQSVVLPCYCAECSDINSQAVSVAALRLGELGVATCPRRGHPVDVVADAVPLGRVKAAWRLLPSAFSDLIARAPALFSSAGVEARMARSEGSGAHRSRLGPYRIIRLLSEGGMAQIFLATRDSLGGFEKPVAIKIFRRHLVEVARETVQMFLKEAKLCANLNHPNIIQIFDVGEQDGELYIAMEYLDGLDLRSLRRRYEAPLPAGLVAHVGAQVAAALSYAHQATDLSGRPMQIVHRDVSPQNILLAHDGRIKLIDFGIALAGAELAVQRSTVAGNASFMSPEQCRGEALDGRSDLFALGAVLHELLSGVPLFRRESMDETMTAVLRDPVPPLPAAPPSLARVVLRALEREPAKRYQLAAEMGEALEGVAASLGVGSLEVAQFIDRVVHPESRPNSLTPAFVVTAPRRAAAPASPLTSGGTEIALTPPSMGPPAAANEPAVAAPPLARRWLVVALVVALLAAAAALLVSSLR